MRTLGSRGGRGGTVGIIVESAGAEAAVALDAVQGRVVAHPDDGLRSTKKIEVIFLGPCAGHLLIASLGPGKQGDSMSFNLNYLHSLNVTSIQKFKHDRSEDSIS